MRIQYSFEMSKAMEEAVTPVKEHTVATDEYSSAYVIVKRRKRKKKKALSLQRQGVKDMKQEENNPSFLHFHYAASRQKRS